MDYGFMTMVQYEAEKFGRSLVCVRLSVLHLMSNREPY